MKTLKEQTINYYADQLARVKFPRSEYAPTLVINHESGNTNHLSLNDESATEVVKWLSDHWNIRKNENAVLINNDMRVYQIVTSTGKQFFCNIEDLNHIVKDNNMHQGYFKIWHFWNNKAQRVSKKDLKSFFEGAQLKQEFFY